MQIKKGIRRWSLLALGWSCSLSFQGSILATPQRKAQVDKSKKVEINWCYMGFGEEEEDAKKVEVAINNYIATKTDLNCTLKLNYVPFEDYDDRLQEMIEAGEDFDICFTSNWINDYYSRYDAFWDLDEALPLYAPQTKALLGKDYLDGAKINGKLYAIPNNRDKGRHYGLIAREDIVKKYHMDLSKVKSLEDMEPFFEMVKRGEPHMTPLQGYSAQSGLTLLPYENILFFEDIPGAIKKNTSDYKVINQYASEEMMIHYRLMREYYLKGFIELPYLLDEQDYMSGRISDYSSGKYFAVIDVLYPETLQQQERAYGYNYISIPLTLPYMRTIDSVGNMLAISKASKHPERALMLLEQVNTDPQFNNLINFGIEGVHYDVVGKKGDIKIIRGTENQEAYNPGLGWAFGNQLLNHIYDYEDPDMWTKIEAFNNELIISRLLGFNFDTSSVAAEVGACRNVYDMFGPLLEIGAVDPDEYVPLMQQAFKEAGSDKIIAEMQRQVDEWRSNVK